MLVLTFLSHYYAIKAQDILSENKNFSFKLSSTPRVISSSCASCLIDSSSKYEYFSFGEDKELLSNLKNFEGIEGIYVLDCKNKKKVLYEKDA